MLALSISDMFDAIIEEKIDRSHVALEQDQYDNKFLSSGEYWALAAKLYSAVMTSRAVMNSDLYGYMNGLSYEEVVQLRGMSDEIRGLVSEEHAYGA